MQACHSDCEVNRASVCLLLSNIHDWQLCLLPPSNYYLEVHESR